MSEFKLDSIEEAIEEIRKGNLIIVVDDEDRENEGDFVTCAELMTPEKANFMARVGRGLMCAPLSNQRADALDLPYMVGRNTASHETPFTVSIDLLTHGCTTGISAYDRAMTLKFMADPKVDKSEFGRPGHIFPLRANDKGVLGRNGHTEAAVDLCKLAGLQPVGCIIEILNEDGSMARLPELYKLAKEHQLKIVSVADLIRFRLKEETDLEMGVEVNMPTKYGEFKLIPFRQRTTGLEHVALVKGDIIGQDNIITRLHSSCVTGDIFGSMRCECGEQLHHAMRTVEQNGQGIIIYLNQEGRGIGLMNKMKAYKLQEQGMDTVDANLHLGFKADERDYGVGATILQMLQVNSVKLLTNNPEKTEGLTKYGIHVNEMLPLEITPNAINAFYMHTKKERMGHQLKKS